MRAAKEGQGKARMRGYAKVCAASYQRLAERTVRLAGGGEGQSFEALVGPLCPSYFLEIK